mmetsp:Transcript_27725/g.81493  ORF Transcript_27725/g.81493 Transcript_27725/m.81493 type:complete len:222 (-) Transcript_27725:576-1241(-)
MSNSHATRRGWGRKSPPSAPAPSGRKASRSRDTCGSAGPRGTCALRGTFSTAMVSIVTSAVPDASCSKPSSASASSITARGARVARRPCACKETDASASGASPSRNSLDTGSGDVPRRPERDRGWPGKPKPWAPRGRDMDRRVAALRLFLKTGDSTRSRWSSCVYPEIKSEKSDSSKRSTRGSSELEVHGMAEGRGTASPRWEMAPAVRATSMGGGPPSDA